MIRKTFSPFLSLFFPALLACSSSGEPAKGSSVDTGLQAGHSLPAARTPEEALRQLLEGNARHVHRERGWWRSGDTAVATPLALLVNVQAGRLNPGDVFDLPAERLPLLYWEQGRPDWVTLEENMRSGVKLVLVLLPYRETSWPEVLAATANAPQQQLDRLFEQMRKGSPLLSNALAEGKCQLVGAMLHPIHQRIILIPLT